MNNLYYEPNKDIKEIDENEDDFFDLCEIRKNLIDIVDRGDFHIGQSYSDEVNKTIICKKCGNDKFLVGEGDYHTSIKCINCKWELYIHDG